MNWLHTKLVSVHFNWATFPHTRFASIHFRFIWHWALFLLSPALSFPFSVSVFVDLFILLFEHTQYVYWQVALYFHIHSHSFTENKVIEMTQITSITKQLNLESIKSNKLDDYIWVGQIICQNNGFVLNRRDVRASLMCVCNAWHGMGCVCICFTLERRANHTFIEINTNWAKM